MFATRRDFVRERAQNWTPFGRQSGDHRIAHILLSVLLSFRRRGSDSSVMVLRAELSLDVSGIFAAAQRLMTLFMCAPHVRDRSAKTFLVLPPLTKAFSSRNQSIPPAKINNVTHRLTAISQSHTGASSSAASLAMNSPQQKLWGRPADRGVQPVFERSSVLLLHTVRVLRVANFALIRFGHGTFRC